MFMAGKIDTTVPRCLSLIENDCFERSVMASRSSNTSMDWTSKHNLIGHISMSATKYALLGIKRSPQASRLSWSTTFTLDTSGLSNNNNQDTLTALAPVLVERVWAG